MKSLLTRAAAVLLLAGAVAVPSTASAQESCAAPEDVPIVLESGALDGEDRVLCAQDAAGDTAIDALHDAGVKTEDTSGTMPMVCRVDGLPTQADEKCGDALDGPGYWAFLVAKEGKDWGYAAVGLQEYELRAGDFVALKYHPMDGGENVEVAAAADAQTRADATVADEEKADAADADDEGTSFASIALPIAIVAALLVAVAAFVVARRRKA